MQLSAGALILFRASVGYATLSNFFSPAQCPPVVCRHQVNFPPPHRSSSSSSGYTPAMPPPPPQPAQPSQKGKFVHPSAKHAKKKYFPLVLFPFREPVLTLSSPRAIRDAYAIEPISAFYLFLAASLVAALFAPIQDCDETFNYWEPTHYLSHGYGLQTWEYSPDFAIRSWLYIGLHAIVGNIRRLLPHSNKVGRCHDV